MIEISKTVVMRIVVESPMSERNETLDTLQDNGFYLSHCGPKRLSPGETDLTTFRAVAEKELDQ